MRTLFLALIILVASWAFFNPEFFYLHDYLHAARIAEMARGLQEGQLPVVWSGNFGFGYGMPLFLFYAPLPYAVGAGLFMAGLPVVTTVQLLFVFSSIVCAVAGYFLIKELWGSEAGLVGAALLTLAPYRAVNLFVRGALSESWGLAAGVVTLLGVLYIVRRKKIGVVLTWLGTSVLFLSHNLSALIFIPFVLLFAVAFFLMEHPAHLKDWKRMAWVCISLGLGVLSALFYSLPAVLEKDTTHIQSILSGYFDYRLHFVYIRQFFTANWGYGGSAWGTEDGISYFLGWPQLVLLLGAGAFCVKLLSQHTKQTKKHVQILQIVTVAGVLLLLAIFLTTGHSLFVWEQLSVLSVIQFPWRFLNVALIFCAIVAAAAVLWIPAHIRTKVTYVLVVIICALQWQMFKPERFGGVIEHYYYTDSGRIRAEASFVLPDFIPSTFTALLKPAGALVSCQPSSECTQVEVKSQKAHQLQLSGAVTQPTQITLALADFEGWTVFADGLQIEKKQSEQGLVGFTAIPGKKAYTIVFQPTPLRKITWVISLLSMASTAALIFWVYKKRVEL
ncbi:hypothetical protein KA078_00345 [Candidatus Woesebacteria bacterium]|nr:hypothetical protein [Candidatus Woesebacteria bacterium]